MATNARAKPSRLVGKLVKPTSRLGVVCLVGLTVLALHRLHLRRLRATVLRHARRWLAARYAVARAALAHQVESQVERALDRAAAHMRSQLKDNHMPMVIQRATDSFIDGILPDIKHESFRVLDQHLHFLQAPRSPYTPPARSSLAPLSPRRSSRKTRQSTPAAALPMPATADGAAPELLSSEEARWPSAMHLLLLLRRGRATLLNTLWPHDRSVWHCLRSPNWWSLQLLGMLPVVRTPAHSLRHMNARALAATHERAL